MGLTESVVALVLFVAAIAPGYVWTRVIERRVPRAAGGQLREAAAYASVGSICTLAAAAVVLGIPGWVDRQELRSEGAAYLLERPVSGFSAAFGLFVGGYFVAWLWARWIVRGHPRTRAAGTIWVEVFGRRKEDALFATVGLTDGRVLAGPTRGYSTASDSSERDLVLTGAIKQVRPQGGLLETASFLIPADQISYVATNYRKLPAEDDQKDSVFTRAWSFFLAWLKGPRDI